MKNWNDDEGEEIDFLKKEEEKIAAENAKLESEKQAQATKDAIRQKNLSKFQSNGKQLLSAEMKTSWPSGKIEQKAAQPGQPVKLTNHLATVSSGQNKKWEGDEKGQQESARNGEVKAQPQAPAIIKKEQKVKLLADEEDKFEETRRLAKEKMEKLEKEALDEQNRLEEEKKAKQSNVKKAADKFKPKTQAPEAKKPTESTSAPTTAPQAEVKPAKTEEKQAPKDAKKAPLKKSSKAANMAPELQPKEKPVTASSTNVKRKWSDDDEPIRF